MICFGLVLGALCAACDTGGDVRLIPVYPPDETDLLDDAKIRQIDVELFAADQRDGDPVVTEILPRTDPLQLDGLAEGPWVLVLHGKDAAGAEIVFGETHPFRIVPSKATEVRVFFARLNAFNFTELQPAEIAASIDGLHGHAATPFRDADGKQWILVTGGYTDGAIATPDAYVIDPSDFTAVQLDTAMSKGRIGHTAIAIEPPGRAPVVVIADGDSAPITSLDVFDSATGEFRTVDAPCGPSAGAGIVPALTRDEQGALVPSGRVIIPGAELCVVDPYGESAAETWPSPTGEEPVAPAMSSSNAAGQLVVVDRDGAVWVDSAVERADVADQCASGAANVWSSLEPRVGGRLSPVGPSGTFAVIGGGAPSSTDPDPSDWALISISGCDVTRVVEGDDDDPAVDSLVDPVVLDLSSANSAPAVDLLVTGGTESEGSNSAALIGDTADGFPLWYGDVGDHTPLLRAARQGHAVAVLENRSAWVIGGGGGQNGWAEIFEIGEGAAPLGAAIDEFATRRPVLTAMTVLDETEAAADLTALLMSEDEQGNNDFVETLVGQPMAATVYLLGKANRGIGDDLMNSSEFELPDDPQCESHPDVDYETIINGFVYGDDVTGINQDLEVFEGGDEAAYDAAQGLIGSTMGGVKTLLLDPGGNGDGARFSYEDPEAVDTCQWRQYVRVGFEGLGLEGAVKDATFSGVNVLLWVVSDDDCSQGVFGETDADDLLLLPSPSPDDHMMPECTDPAMDAYFYPATSNVSDVVSDLVWNPEDLIVGLIGQSGTVKEDPEWTETDWGLPRRLEAVAEDLEDMNAAIVPMFVDDLTDFDVAKDKFVEKLGALRDAIKARNPYQVCVPDALIGDSEAEFVPDVGDHGLFRPLLEGDTGRAGILDRVGKSCRAFRVRESLVSPDSTRYARVSSVDDSLQIGVDTDLRAGCPRGWTVYLGSGADEAASITLHLQCIIGE